MASTAPGSSAVDRVTIWTSVGYLEKEGSSKAKAEMRYYFESQVFYDVTALQMPEYLQTRLRASEEANVPLIMWVAPRCRS